VRDLLRLLRLHRLYHWFLKRLDTSSLGNLWLVHYLRITWSCDNKFINHLTFFTRFLFFVRLNSNHNFLLCFFALPLERIDMSWGTKLILLAHLCRQIYPLLLYHISNYIMASCISELLNRRLLLSPYIIDMRIVL